MKKKIKVFLMLICISAVFCTNAFAVSKKDIIGYVNSQTVCGDVGLFNTYKTTFTRLLKQKKLSDTELSTIYSYLKNSVGILNSKGVCKVADLSKLTNEEKNAVYNNLTAGASVITSAPMLEFDEEENKSQHNTDKGKDKDKDNIVDTDDYADINTNISNNTNNSNDYTGGTKVTVNTQDNTMDIYENGILVDKVSMASQKMTYTGANINFNLIVIVSTVVFVVNLVLFIILAKKRSTKVKFVKNMLVSIMICATLVSISIILFGDKIQYFISMLDLVSIASNNEEIEVELNSDKSIKKYPSYGLSYGTLTIERLNIKNAVYFGDMSSLLSLGVGHSTWSDMPTEGGTIVYSGHNSKDKLNELRNIQIGDKILVDTSYAKCTYEVKKTEVLKEHEVDKLMRLGEQETLILYTCYPFDNYIYTDERFVVYSVLKEIKWK